MNDKEVIEKVKKIKEFIENKNIETKELDLPNKTQKRYVQAWKELIKMVEDLTETKIDFNYLYWGL